MMLTVASSSTKVKPQLQRRFVRRMMNFLALCTTGYSGQFTGFQPGVNRMAKKHWASNWNVGVRVWVERKGHAILGEGRAELLAAIDNERSITKAAKAAGMSYRRAWNLIQAVNEAAGETLVEAAVGGKQGGGARLTTQGRLALSVYDDVRKSMIESAAGALRHAIRSDTANTNTTIHLAAAISLQEAVGQILAEYMLVEPTVRVRAIFGASNELADHLLAGAPGDLFIAAEASQIDRLEVVSLVRHASRRAVAKNGLAIVSAPRMPSVTKLADLLAEPFARIAVAEPECPLGKYSHSYLEKSAAYARLQSKLLLVDNSRAVLAAVASGAAQAGVAFSSDASAKGAWILQFRVPISQAAATYTAAIVGRGKAREETRALFEYLSSPTARRCFQRCGLRPVKP
jgi:molybdenum ABC transporter molybdate-binding protein